MKKLLILILLLSSLMCTGCAKDNQSYDVVATTLPVYDFTSLLCEGTDLTVGRLVTENISCLHDYTLQVSQMRMLEKAQVVVLSGLGLEDFLQDALTGSYLILDVSVGVHTHAGNHHHESDPLADHGHSHETDPHIWLSPENAIIMADNLARGLTENYPEYKDTISQNLLDVRQKIQQIQDYADEQLAELNCRELITFHDGFTYFAESFGLTILEAVEEESGSEASAAEIIHLAELIRNHNIPAVFTETNGSDACAGIIHNETGAAIYTLDMAMSGDSYFKAMYHNIDIIKEALG